MIVIFPIIPTFPYAEMHTCSDPDVAVYLSSTPLTVINSAPFTVIGRMQTGEAKHKCSTMNEIIRIFKTEKTIFFVRVAVVKLNIKI